jgi:hypothetical protein
MGRPVGESTGKHTIVEPGVMISEAEIKEIDDLSGMDIGKGYEPEVCVELKVDMGDFEKKFKIMGSYRRAEGSNVITGHHKYSDVIKFLSRVLGKGAMVNDDWSLDMNVLKQTVGKKILILQYVNGLYDGKIDGKQHLSWQPFGAIGVPGQHVADDLHNEFKASLERGWPRDFKPDIYVEFEQRREDDSTSFDYGDNVEGDSDTPPPPKEDVI